MIFKRDGSILQGDLFTYTDEGPVSDRKNATRRFAVKSRYNRSLIGYVRWAATYRQYILAGINLVLKWKELAELAEFCQTMTEEQRQRGKK